MNKLLSSQHQLMTILGVNVDRSSKEFPVHLTEAIIGLVIEAAEVAEEINLSTKPWKQLPAHTREARMLEETIDVLFYLLEIWVMLGVTGDRIRSEYQKKWERNVDRVAESALRERNVDK